MTSDRRLKRTNISGKQSLLEATSLCNLLPCKVPHRPCDCCRTRHTHFSFYHCFLHWTETWIQNAINNLLTCCCLQIQFHVRFCLLTCCSSTSPTLFTTVSSPSLAFRRSKKTPTSNKTQPNLTSFFRSWRDRAVRVRVLAANLMLAVSLR